jgi:hypothetical protein
MSRKAWIFSDTALIWHGTLLIAARHWYILLPSSRDFVMHVDTHTHTHTHTQTHTHKHTHTNTHIHTHTHLGNECVWSASESAVRSQLCTCADKNRLLYYLIHHKSHKDCSDVELYIRGNAPDVWSPVWRHGSCRLIFEPQSWYLNWGFS